MKKILGLLVTVAVCSMVACNESGETAVAPSYQNPSQQPQAQNPQVNADSIAQHVRDSIEALYATPSSSSMDPFAGQFLSSSSFPGMMFSSSSIIGFSSSSSIFALSSSSIAVRSSSSKATPRSSATVADESTVTLEFWDGSAGDPHVPVGNKSGGWWYGYNDESNGGASEITWEVEPGAKGDMTPVVEACGGVCGSFTLVQGTNTNDPFIGFAFGFGANDKASGDISSIRGICVQYKSTAPMTVAIGLTAAMEKSYGWDVPAYELSKSGSLTVENIPWASFKQQWTSPAEITGALAAKEASSIKFQIKAEDGTTGSFNVTRVGPLGSCE